VNWEHLKAIAWLRWRLSVNQWRRSGTLNLVIMLIIVATLMVTSVVCFFASIALGVFLLPKASAEHLFVMWDIIVVVFLFGWLIGLVSELQRSEPLSLEKLLHLPLSLSGAFLLNYLGSLLSLSLIIFLPITVGLCIAMTLVHGPRLLIVFMLLASFVLMVTAVTHQFRGWLFALMANKRRRRTIIAVVTGAFILLVQLPNIINITVQRKLRDKGPDRFQVAIQELQSQHASGEIETEEFRAQEKKLIDKRQQFRDEQRAIRFTTGVRIAKMVNVVLPIGWLPYGVYCAAQGSLWPGLLGVLGATAIGSLSLWRSYRATLRFFTAGDRPGGPKRKKEEKKEKPASESSQPTFLEKKLPWMSEQAGVVCLASLRSLLRAPESKMMLLTPVILLAFFGSMIFLGRDRAMPDIARPFLALGAISITILCYVQLLCNVFGFDRDGFRVYILSPCPRRDILLGKNMSFAPLAIGMCLLALVVLQFLLPLEISHFLATLLQLVAVYSIYCLMGNFISVIAPSAVSAGSLKPAQAKLVTVLIHVFTALLSPLAFVPALIPLGAELALDHYETLSYVPVYLIVSVVELIVVVWIYRRMLDHQGRLLQVREQRVLEAVTAKVQ
jgi:uncharacterized membrane protein